ncbi:hypothetical protein DdX_02319 [Ditylenchus destructor]|uniref:Uncharacterized protein n=1 Tax=Ditylenchus destructor TaxID=166010 RepID=A0AAD4NHF6_9BILA|nr:hypothetical protein DdX_02319 [Ditylenchus destructor]
MEMCEIFGAVLISQRNEIVHVFGNVAFRKCIAKESETAVLVQPNIPSTSGISSSSSSLPERVESTTTIVEDNGRNIAQNAKKIDINKDSLLPVVLPFVLLHRSRQEKTFSEAEHIESDRYDFQLTDLSGSYTVVFISSKFMHSSEAVESFKNSIMRCLNFHYGPYIHLLDTGTAQMAKLMNRVERRMEKLMYQYDKHANIDESLNINLSFKNTAKMQTLSPLFQEIATKITQANSNHKCRCIFVNSGQIIGCTSSQSQESRSLFEVMDTQELSSLLEFSLCPSESYLFTSTNKKCMKCHVEQAWIYSNIMRRRQLLNVFVFSLTGEVELICLVNADHTLQISSLCDLLDNLEMVTDHLNTNTQDNHTNNHMDMVVQEIAQLNLWNRLNNELARYRGTQDVTEWSPASNIPATLSRLTLSRIGSSLSLFSNGSSSPSASNGRRGSEITARGSSRSTWTSSSVTRHSRASIAHVDAMKTQLKRMVKGVLGEVIHSSFKVAKYRLLDRMHTIVRQTVDRRMNQSMEMVLSDMAKSWSEGNPLRPMKLGLDMLGYRFSAIEIPFNYSYIPDKYRIIFSKLGRPKPESGMIVARTPDGQLIILISNQPSESSDHKKKSGFKLRIIKSENISTVCIALFSECVNVSLAIRQTYQLISTLEPELNRMLQIFY